MSPRRSILSAVALVSAGLLALSACTAETPNDNGGSTTPTGTTEPGGGATDNEFFAMLPQEIQDAGVLKVGTEAYYPPYEFFDDDQETIIGLDPELDQALADVLGLELDLQNMAFSGLLAALDSKRIDVVSAALGATEERLEKYDFVSYFNATQGITVAIDNPNNVQSKADLCGLNLSVLEASAQLGMLEEMNENECASNKMNISAFPTDADALQQIVNGRADANLAQFAVADYSAKNFGDGKQFAVISDESFGPYYLGKVVRKSDTQLRDAMLAAFNHLIETGKYEEILAKYDLVPGAMSEAEINKIAQ